MNLQTSVDLSLLTSDRQLDSVLLLTSKKSNMAHTFPNLRCKSEPPDNSQNLVAHLRWVAAVWANNQSAVRANT